MPSHPPHLSRIPPRFHHVFTIQKHGGNLQTPCNNTPSTPNGFFLQKTIESNNGNQLEGRSGLLSERRFDRNRHGSRCSAPPPSSRIRRNLHNRRQNQLRRHRGRRGL